MVTFLSSDNTFGQSSPANPTLVVMEPKSNTTAPTSSKNIKIKRFEIEIPIKSLSSHENSFFVRGQDYIFAMNEEFHYKLF